MPEQAMEREWRTGGRRVQNGPLAYSPPPVGVGRARRATDAACSLIRDLSDWSWREQPAI